MVVLALALAVVTVAAVRTVLMQCGHTEAARAAFFVGGALVVVAGVAESVQPAALVALVVVLFCCSALGTVFARLLSRAS